jgi:hypothetical protein
MTRMRIARALTAALVAGCLAACGSSGAEETGSGGVPESGTRATTTTAEATTTTEAATTTTVEGEEPEVTVPPDADVVIQLAVEEDEVTIRSGGGGGGGEGRVVVEADERVRLQVTADRAETVQLHGYALSAPVAPGTPATIDFVADQPGLFLIELTPSHQFLAQLAVEP